MRVCIHRGAKQIGGSCVEIESSGKRIVIDLGLPLDAESDHNQYIPQISGLKSVDPTLLAIVISHPHIDHFGLLANVSQEIPIAIGPAARKIMKAAAPFFHDTWVVPHTGWDFVSGVPFVIGPFIITPFLMDHSAYDAYALLIESEGKCLFYSGDFRAHGRKFPLFEKLLNRRFKPINALLIEGSSLSRLNNNEHFPSETDIESEMVNLFKHTEGIVLVHASAQNIDRIVSIFRASKRSGRRFVMDLYTAAILEATGNPKLPQSYWPEVFLYIPQRQRIQIKNNAWFDLLKRHSTHRIFIENLKEVSKQSVLLFRQIHQVDLEKAGCLSGASYIFSQWEGYWEQESFSKLKEWLLLNNIPIHHIHTSGHASPIDLQRLKLALHPDKIVPIHTFNPERYSEIFTNVEIHSDREWWEV